MSRVHNFGPGDSGRSITAKVGDTVVLALPENPTTGFRWHEADLPGSLELAGDSYGPMPEGGIGQQNVRILRLLLRTPGRQSLQLSRMRTWEGPQSSDNHFTLTIDVSE